MRFSYLGGVAAIVLAAALAGCASRPPRHVHRQAEWHSPVGMLLRYAGPNGDVTRAEMEAGLRKDFAAADKNHDGVLEPDEMRAVNQARWNEDKSATSPLVDWNGDGVIEFNEFAATARALFGQLDRNNNGVLTPDELEAGGAGPRRSGSNQDQENRDRRGRRGRGRGPRADGDGGE